MKLDIQKKNIQSANTLTESKFGISTKDQSHILTILRDKLYSDKILAVIREYSTNAVDAHVEAGKPEEPIKVTLPTWKSPKLFIRDYGAGLTEEEVFEIYVQYGASTKRSSNSVIGQLGLGCKSAFAYTDAFVIVSYNGGKKTIYHAYIDESNMGKVVKMSEEPSSERTGVEIQIPVKNQDVHEFVSKAQTLYQYFDVLPINNANITKKIKPIVSGSNWYIPESVGYGQSAVAIMGNIGYPINTDILKRYPEWTQRMQSLCNAGVILKVNIGELSISASRENLEYTDQTVQNLLKALGQVLDEFGEEIQSDLDESESMWEAARKWHKYRQSFQYHTKELVPNTWNGKEIKQQIQLSDEERPNFAELGNYPQRRFRPHRVNLAGLSAILIDDVSSAPVKRGTTLITEKKYSSTLIYTHDDKKDTAGTDAAVKDFIETHELQGIPIHRLSNVDYKKVSVAKGSQGLAKVKASTYIFSHSPNTSVRGGWVPATIDTDEVTEAIYLPIERYKSTIGKKIGPKELKQTLKTMTGKDIVIYGVRSNKVEKLPKGWVPADKYVEKLCRKFYKGNGSKYKYVMLASEIHERVKGSYYSYHYGSNNNWYVVSKEDRRKSDMHRYLWMATVGQLKNQKLKNILTKAHAARSLVQRFDLEEKLPEVGKNTPGDILGKIQAKYPMLKYVHLSSNTVKDVLTYCETMEIAKKEKKANGISTSANGHNG